MISARNPPLYCALRQSPRGTPKQRNISTLNKNKSQLRYKYIYIVFVSGFKYSLGESQSIVGSTVITIVT